MHILKQSYAAASLHCCLELEDEMHSYVFHIGLFYWSCKIAKFLTSKLEKKLPSLGKVRLH